MGLSDRQQEKYRRYLTFLLSVTYVTYVTYHFCLTRVRVYTLEIDYQYIYLLYNAVYISQKIGNSGNSKVPPDNFLLPRVTRR